MIERDKHKFKKNRANLIKNGFKLREEIKRFKGFRICDKCPCLNTDYEDGEGCNLGYGTNLIWFDKKGNKVEDTPKMREHQENYDLFYASKNCQAVKIEAKDKIIYFNPI